MSEYLLRGYVGGLSVVKMWGVGKGRAGYGDEVCLNGE
jgi:hypothetical protein